MYLDTVWWFRVILEGAVFLIGVPGNLIIIRVYASKKNKVTPHIFIIGLAAADFSVCLCRIITLLKLFPPFDRLSESSQFFCRASPTVDAWPKYTSIILTSAIAIDRYFAICRPHDRRFTVQRARYAVTGCFVASLLITVSYLFTYGVITTKNGSLACRFVVPDWMITTQFIVMIVSFFVSLALLVVLYVKIYRTVRKMSKVRPGNTVSRGAPTMSMHGPSQVSTDGSTVRAEQKIVPNRAINTVESTVDFKIQWTGTTQQLNDSDEDHPPKLGVGEGGAPTVAKSAWTADEDQQKMLSLVNLPHTSAPGTSSLNTQLTANRKDPHNTVKTASATREADGSESKQSTPTFHRRTTLMLFLTTVVFVVTLMPLCFVIGFYFLIVQVITKNEAVRFVVNVATYLNLVNNAANPVLYCLVNRRFREDMFGLFRGFCMRH